MIMKRFQPVKFIFCLAALGVFACSPKIDNRGYMKDGDLKEKVIVGKSTKDEVLAELGSPSSQSSFGNETWYYISSREETHAFLSPKITEQNVMRIEFDGAGVVSAVSDYDKESAKKFDIVKRTTPTEGHSMGVVEQFLGNLGRFNTPKGNDSIATGRRGY